MTRKVIIVPVDGASNIKLEVYDFDTLECLYSISTATPVRVTGGLDYNDAGTECAWFDEIIRALPSELREAAVIAPVARGASGGLFGSDGALTEVPGESLALAYTQRYPERVEARFRELAGSAEEFFLETGSIRDFPGSLTLVKRLLFEEMERPQLLDRARGFATYGIILSGHFLGDDLREAWRSAGNEHSYWMCHSGARDIRERPGVPSSVAKTIAAFGSLVPPDSSVAYRPIAGIPASQAAALGLPADIPVAPGGHDTCLSHIPVMATFAQAFPNLRGRPVIQVEAGSWTMIARIGGGAALPRDGYLRDIIVQGTVDGEPVVTARYGGGNDFRQVRGLVEGYGGSFVPADAGLLERIAAAADCFLLPNISPVNQGTGPFPEIRGKVIGEDRFFGEPGAAFAVTNLTTSLAASVQVEAVSTDRELPLVITAGGAKDPLFGRLLATFTGRAVYAMADRHGNPVTETTSLGAAITGKAAVLGIHPYAVDAAGLGVSYRPVEPFEGSAARALEEYREAWLRLVTARIIVP